MKQAVLGAPAGQQAVLQDIQLSPELTEKIKQNLECVRDVVSEVIKDSEVQVWWGEAKTNIARLYNEDWKKCMEAQNVEEQQT